MQATAPYTWRRRVGMRDVDAFGVVWYGNYLGFCDEARAELLRANGLAPVEFIERGYIAPVVEVQSRHHHPARFDEELDIHVRIPRARGTRIHFEFTIRRAGDSELIAKIETTMVLCRSDGDLVYLVPEPFKRQIDAMITKQPSSTP